MGARLISKNETTFAHLGITKKDILLENWRAIREDKLESVDGLYIVTLSFRLYFIPSFTMDMFHEANRKNQKLDIPYQYVKNVLSCLYCYGDGKVDWVEAARGPRPKNTLHGYTPKFIRSKNGPINIVNYDPRHKPYYASTTMLRKGEELCKFCSGSGLLLVRNKRIIDTITLTDS